MIVLGIDPGSSITGWGVISKASSSGWETMGYGVIKTDSSAPFALRLSQIFRQLSKIIQDYKPETVAVEQLFFSINKKNVILVSHARGAALLAASEAGVPVAEYSVLQVKSSLVGYGRAEKGQMQKMVKAFLKLKEIPEPDDIADALAVAICHINSEKMNKIKGL
jgi:crossover junction endodeoxyribonuclease RuvC